jgi:integrase
MAIYADKKDNKLTGRWRVELQLDGQRVRDRFDTLEEARAFEAKTRRDMASGKVPQKAKVRVEKRDGIETLDQLCRAAQGHLWAGTSSERLSLLRLEAAVRLIGPSRSIESITITDIDRMVKLLRDRESAPGTINRYLSAINMALKWAHKRGHRTGPLPELAWQDEDEGRIRWITLPEEASLMSLLPRPEALAVYVAIRTGLRRGELLGLQARDVEPSWVHLWGSGTKSGKGRSIPLTIDVYNALREFLALGKTTVEGLRYQWNKAKALMGLSEDADFVFHACRHTFATRAVQAGVHPRVLQRLMGHSHLSTTMRYMQVSDGMLTAAIEQMSPTGSLSTSLKVVAGLGALQGGAKALNPPIDTAREHHETLGYSEA